MISKKNIPKIDGLDDRVGEAINIFVNSQIRKAVIWVVGASLMGIMSIIFSSYVATVRLQEEVKSQELLNTQLHSANKFEHQEFIKDLNTKANLNQLEDVKISLRRIEQRQDEIYLLLIKRK
jgi:hypothetical protein